MPSQTTRKRRYFPVPTDVDDIEECFIHGAEYDEDRHELFFSDWQQTLSFVRFFENSTVPQVTDLAITETRGNVTEVNFGWSGDEKSHQHIKTDAQQRRPFMSKKKIYLDCPYQDKDECKALGGRWDPDYRKWYVPAGLNLDPFRIWWSGDLNSPVDHPLEQK